MVVNAVLFSFYIGFLLFYIVIFVSASEDTYRITYEMTYMHCICKNFDYSE